MRDVFETRGINKIGVRGGLEGQKLGKDGNREEKVIHKMGGVGSRKRRGCVREYGRGEDCRPEGG